MGTTRSMHGKLKEMRILQSEHLKGRPRHRRGRDNMKKHFKETRVGWIHLAQDWVQWRVLLVNTVKSPRFRKERVEFPDQHFSFFGPD
jgi:hypothetical protein